MSDAPNDSDPGAATPSTNDETKDKSPLASEGAKEEGRTGLFRRRANLQSAKQQLQPTAPPPPPPRPRRREGTLSALSGFLSFLLLVGVGGAFALIAVQHKLHRPGPLAADKVVYIPPRGEGQGSFAQQAISQLEREGVIDSPFLMQATLIVERGSGRLQSGEYLFKRHASLRDVIDILVKGRHLLHSITIPEGLTSEQVVQRLRESDVLSGDVNEIPKEGSLLPETYKAQRNFSRSKLITKMQADQRKLIDQIWARRAADLSLKTPYELVTLASIVEKETGRSEERAHVASVFLNRLRKGMRLQSDPTIVYGLVGGKGSLGRGILRSEVDRPTSYNTYAIEGLPPGPIANPGRAALEAVANPAHTRDLYFVADGNGGHVFAETLEEHGRNVQRWRQIERDQKDKGPEEVDRVSPLAPLPPTPPPGRERRGDAGFDSIGRIVSLAPRHDDYAPGRAMAGDKGAPLRLARVPWIDAVTLLGIAEDASGANASHARSLRRVRAFFTYPSAQLQDRVTIDPSFLIGRSADAESAEEQASAEPEAGSDAAIAFIGGESPESYPVSARLRAEQKARAARLGLPLGSDELPSDVVGKIPDGSSPAAAPIRARRPHAFDASEGTPLDPLRDKSWDLSSAKVVPSSASLH
jgi:UPF0755 protein